MNHGNAARRGEPDRSLPVARFDIGENGLQPGLRRRAERSHQSNMTTILNQPHFHPGGAADSRSTGEVCLNAPGRTGGSLSLSAHAGLNVVLAMVGLICTVPGGLCAQPSGSNDGRDQGRALQEPPGQGPEGAPATPHEAFNAGQYDQAAAGFSRRAERRPKDPAAQFNLGSALHQLEDYDGAKAAFEKALSAEEKSLRAKAVYDLGNTAYRQGLLEEAISRYTEALALDPDDDDAKHNLEFVQQELKRREEQAEQRQQNQQNEGDSEQEQSDSGEQDSEGGENQSDSQQQEQSGSDQENQEQQDSDGDGLSDRQEREAENPTDPNRADSDGDGRSDGEEDKNRNGRVDEGESNPNRPDEAPAESADQDSQEPESSDGDGSQQPQQGQPNQLSPEQAERLLAALQDQRPASSRKLPEDARKAKSAKDW